MRVADLVLAAIVSSLAFATCADCGAEAQAVSRRARLMAEARERQQTYILARVCVSEGGWDSGEVCYAYHRALVNKSARVRVRWDTHARDYTRLFDANRPPSRIWLLGLGESDAVPIGWPSGLPWRAPRARRGAPPRVGYLDRWHAEVASAREVVRHPHNPCNGEPTDWGSGDEQVAKYMREYPRAVEIDCPGDDRFFRPEPE